MKKILGVAGALLLLLGSATAGFADDPVEIFYSLNNVSGNTWEYDYNVVNHSLALNGGVLAFNTYFPVVTDGNNFVSSDYANLHDVTPFPDGWKSAHIVQPGASSYLDYRGVWGASGDADVYVDIHGGVHFWDEIKPIPQAGQSLSGFGVTFTYLGQGTPPGPQSFEVLDLTTWQVVPGGSGTTEPLAAVPLPPAVYILGIGLIGLGFARKKI
jgi:hypothetical protein